ncbi:MAG: hypothetical protein PHO02_06810 [Candidatus Nanoarchaeia archaeon]|nr:hypothetical protein [Candidatus Nanoarchaeia archaeon]
MKKSVLSLVIIAALFMVPILSFEASARNAYGEACIESYDCTSAICLTINPEIIPPEKMCGCRFDGECSAFPSTVCSTLHNKCISSSAKAVGQTCRSGSECLSTLCTAGVCACKVNADCGTGKTCTVSTGQCSSGILSIQAAQRELQAMPLAGTSGSSASGTGTLDALINEINEIILRIRVRLIPTPSSELPAGAGAPCTTNADCTVGYCFRNSCVVSR